MKTTEQQARALAYLLHEVRPDWGIDATVKVIGKHLDHAGDLGALVVAAMSAARDPQTLTPGRIFQIGAFWPADVQSCLPRPPACEDHPTFEAPTCRCCWADVKCGDRPVDMVGKHLPSMLERLEATLGSVRL